MRLARPASLRLSLATLTCVVLTIACGDDDATMPGDDAGPSGLDASTPPRDATALPSDGAAHDDGASPPADGGVTPSDAGVLPPIRDDALLPEWRWDEKAARVIDPGALDAAWAATGFSLPPSSELYAARIVPGVDGPAYVLYEAGGGAFSQDFWPASTVKLLSTLGALDFIGTLGFTGAATVTFDSGFSDVVSAIYDRAIRVSSNIDYVRTFRIAGFDRLNVEFLAPDNGFPTTILQRSYVSGVSVRTVPGFTLTEGAHTDYVPARDTSTSYGCPVDGNCADLFELTEAVRRVMLNDELPAADRFSLAPADLAGVQDALCGADPSFFRAGVDATLGPAARVCHKPGWVPDNDCLDHALVDDAASGERYLLAASTPVGAALTECDLLAGMASSTITALRAATTGTPLQHDAGPVITVQLDDHGTSAGRRAYTITVDAPGADRVELFVDRTALGEVSAAGPRFALDYAFSVGGERLLVVRAWSGAAQHAYRALRVAITAP